MTGIPGSDLSVSVNLRAIVSFALLGGPLVTALVFVLQLRQDVRANTTRLMASENEVRMLKDRVSALERAKLVYCIQAASADTSSHKRAGNSIC